MTEEQKKERIKAVKAMEFLARQVNSEFVMEYWLTYGVPDGDIEYGDLGENETDEELVYMVEDDDGFAELMKAFLCTMSRARKDGGLYCGDVLSV